MSGEGDTYTLEEKKSTILKSRENMMRTAAKLYYSQWKMNPKSQAAFSFLKNKYRSTMPCFCEAYNDTFFSTNNRCKPMPGYPSIVVFHF